MLHQLLGNVEDMTAGQPHVDLRRDTISSPCLSSEDYFPPTRQRQNSKLTGMSFIYLWRTRAHIAHRLSLIGGLLGTYDILLLRVCPNLRTRVSLFASTVRSTTERDDSRATIREPKQTFDRSRALSSRPDHSKNNLIIDQSTKCINLIFSDTSRNR